MAAFYICLPSSLIQGKYFTFSAETLSHCWRIWDRFDHEPVISNVASWITSGWYLTSPAAFLEYYYRAMCQLTYHLTRQVPEKANMRVDFKKLAECFSLEDEKGNTITPEPWELHPGSLSKSVKFECTRQEAASAWEAHKAEQGRYLPHVVHRQFQDRGMSACRSMLTPIYLLPMYSAKQGTNAQGSRSRHKRKHSSATHEEQNREHHGC